MLKKTVVIAVFLILAAISRKAIADDSESKDVPVASGKINDRISVQVTEESQENCYIVKGKSGTLYIIDPGGDAEKTAEEAKRFNAEEKIILLTHGHCDHLYGLKETAWRLAISKVFIYKGDISIYKNPDPRMGPLRPEIQGLPEPCPVPVTDDFILIHTPGHSSGGCCFYFKDLNALFSGDTIFRNSIGRTDIPGGNQEKLIKSIKEKIMTLPPDTVIYPGHGPSTTVADEKMGNPYI